VTAGGLRAPARAGSARPRQVPSKLESAAIIVALALLGWVLLRPSPVPDSYWALIWGRDVLGGELPQVDAPDAPSAHPLAVAIGAVVGLFGRAQAVDLFNGLVLLSLGATLVGIFRFGQIVFGTAVAWAAVAAALCNFTLANVVMFSSLDTTAYALTVWAAVLVAARPLNGAAPLILLGIAGLQRPEVWMLSAALWLYLAASLRDRRRAAGLMLLAAAPVACWVAFDLVVTHRFGSSLNEIRSIVAGHEAPVFEQLKAAVPPAFPLALMPVAMVGMALAVRMRCRPAILPAAIGFLGLVAAGVYLLADIVVVSRFLVVTALMGALFVGYAVMGGVGRPGRIGRAWRIGGVLAGLVVIVVGARQVNGVQGVRESLGDDARASAQEFARLAAQPRAARVLADCAPVWMQAANPSVMYLGAVDPRNYRQALTVPAIGAISGKLPDRGALVGGLPTLGLPRPAGSYRLVVPAGFSRVGSSGRWTLYERDC
jgi:hypothetical protein